MNALMTSLVSGIAIPIIVSTVISAPCLGLRSGKGSLKAERPTLAALAVAAGVLAGGLALLGWTGLPPADVTLWPVWFAGLAWMVCFVTPGSALAVVLAGVVVSAVEITLLIHPLAMQWAPSKTAIAGIGATGATAVWLWFVADGTRRCASAVPVVACLLTGGATTAVALGLSGSVRLAQMAGALTSVTGPILVCAWWAHATGAWLTRSSWVFASALASLLLCGVWYAQLPISAAVCIYAILLVPWLVNQIHARFELSRGARRLFGSLLILFSVGACLGLVWLEVPGNSELTEEFSY